MCGNALQLVLTDLNGDIKVLQFYGIHVRNLNCQINPSFPEYM